MENAFPCGSTATGTGVCCALLLWSLPPGDCGEIEAWGGRQEGDVLFKCLDRPSAPCHTPSHPTPQRQQGSPSTSPLREPPSKSSLRIPAECLSLLFSKDTTLKGLMLKLKLQYFDHLMRRTDSLEKTLMLGKIEGRRKRGQQRMRSANFFCTRPDSQYSGF